MSALELCIDPSDDSPELISAHIRRIEQTLAKCDVDAAYRAHHAGEGKNELGVLLSCAVMCAVAVAAFQDGRESLRQLFAPPSAAKISARALAGDFRISYRYPAYTAKPPRVTEGGDGSVRAPIGTRVTIEAITDLPVVSGNMVLTGGESEQAAVDAAADKTQPDSRRRESPLTVSAQRRIKAEISVVSDAEYHLSLVGSDGQRLEDSHRHPIVAELDTPPEVVLERPESDLELRDDTNIVVSWRARDDYGVERVELVIVHDYPGPDGNAQQRIILHEAGERAVQRDGSYSLSAAALALDEGQGATIFVEGWDNDAAVGGKSGISQKRRVEVFSARRYHEEVLARQRKSLDNLVDWLAEDLTIRLPPLPQVNEAAIAAQGQLRDRIFRVKENLDALVTAIRDDALAKVGAAEAFANVAGHSQRAHQGRDSPLARLRNLAEGRNKNTKAVAEYDTETLQRPLARRFLRVLAREQPRAVAQLERDIVYLDDLLALQKIDELKQTAKDLLSAQRDLRGLLERFRQNPDDALRAQLRREINALRQKMFDLLRKMSQIKKRLPGEYRNMESSSMLDIDDQLSRLKDLLENDDLEGAARELEQLANMIENMVDSIEEREQEYGGERYDELRGKLQEFGQQFTEIERSQAQLQKAGEKLQQQYRERALKRATKDLEQLVSRARALTAKALATLDEMGATEQPSASLEREIERARQRLFDVDALLGQQDLYAARDMANEARGHSQGITRRVKARIERFGERATEPMKKTKQTAKRLHGQVDAIKKLLDKLFPDAEDVLSAEQQQKLQDLAKQQRELAGSARELEQQMNSLRQEAPVFGEESMEAIGGARREMSSAGQDLGAGSIPQGVSGQRQASAQLKKMREAMESASRPGGGLPLPIGASRPGGKGDGRGTNDRDVEIPRIDANEARNRFRQELLEAAKETPPKAFEESVRRYYEELVK